MIAGLCILLCMNDIGKMKVAHHKMNLHPLNMLLLFPLFLHSLTIYKSHSCRIATLFPRKSFVCDKLIDEFHWFNSQEQLCSDPNALCELQSSFFINPNGLKWSGLKTFIHLSANNVSLYLRTHSCNHMMNGKVNQPWNGGLKLINSYQSSWIEAIQEQTELHTHWKWKRKKN